jgi:hypothetical protein
VYFNKYFSSLGALKTILKITKINNRCPKFFSLQFYVKLYQNFVKSFFEGRSF